MPTRNHHYRPRSISRAIYRLGGACILRRDAYEGIASDRHATWTALTIVAASCLAPAAAAGWIAGGPAFRLTAVAGVIGWSAHVALCYVLARTVFSTTDTAADIGALIRTLGFASCPRLLLAAAFHPMVTMPVVLAVAIWTMLTATRALQVASAFSAGRAFGAALSAAVGQWLLYDLFTAIVLR